MRESDDVVIGEFGPLTLSPRKRTASERKR